ncbi:MAG: hypothetical protein E7050_03315 [Lentisphaerae bacterium]|nr:hypothetical protein [Lentisphaerota bacterium]
MLEIIFPAQGEILSRRNGQESADGLTINVIGIARTTDNVSVNGIPARRCGERFEATVTLTDRFSTITATSSGNRGKASREIQVVYDKNSFRRVNFCIDDVIFTLREIAQSRPASLFDHFYLRNMKTLHDKYGMKITLNLFHDDLRSNFTLAQFPDTYKQEWIDNSDWLKLSFHAKAEFPDRPYQNAEVEQLIAEYDEVCNEIIRFAGAETFIAPPNIHWAMVKPAALPLLRKRGLKFLGGLFVNARTRIGESTDDAISCDIGYFRGDDDSLFLSQKQLFYDFANDICFGTEAIVCNLEEMPELERKLASLIADSNNEALHLLSHEQYSYPFYESYLPDHDQRLALTVKMLSEAGFEFVFFNEGFLGNTR